MIHRNKYTDNMKYEICSNKLLLPTPCKKNCLIIAFILSIISLFTIFKIRKV